MTRLLAVRLLGGFEVLVDGCPVPAASWRRRSAANLVMLLALDPRHRLARDRIADALWPARDGEAGATNTRRAAHYARRAIGAEDAVVLDEGWVELAPGWDVVTDVEDFVEAAQAAAHEGDVAAFGQAADLYTGDLLPDELYEDWCAAERERLRSVFVDTLFGARRWEELVALDPTNEPAHRAIMRARIDAGDRGAALRQFEALRGALRELGLTPDEQSVALYTQALEPAGEDAPTPAERARALLAWGVVHWERADLVEARRAAEDVKALAVDAGLGREYVEATQLLGLIAYAQGAWRDHFGEAVVEAIERTPEMAPFVFDAHVCMSEFSLHEPGGTVAARRLSDRIHAAAVHAGSSEGRALALLLEGEAGLLEGDDEVGLRDILAEAARLHESAGRATGAAVATERLAQVMDRAGEAASAEHLHARALQLATRSSMSGHLVPFVYGGMVKAAPPEQVPALLEAAESACARLTTCETCSMALHVFAVPALVQQGDLDRARHHLAAAEHTATRWSGGDWAAAVLEDRAAIRHADGAPDDEVRGLLAQATRAHEAADRARDAERNRRRGSSTVTSPRRRGRSRTGR